MAASEEMTYEEILAAYEAGKKSAQPKEAVTAEEAEEFRKALELQEEMVAAGEAGVIRERVKASMNAALGIPETVVSVCTNCATPGLWLADAPRPLYCRECFPLFKEDAPSIMSTLSTTDATTTEEDQSERPESV